MKWLVFVLLFCACGSNIPDIKQTGDIEYVVRFSSEVGEFEIEDPYVVVKLDEAKFDVGGNGLLGYDYKQDQCTFILEYENDTYDFVLFFNDFCNTTVNSFCVFEGLELACYSIGELPESMRGKLDRILINVFENKELQDVLSCFKSTLLFNDKEDISICEKGETK